MQTLAQHLADTDVKVLVVATAHVTQETCDDASNRSIPWAITYGIEYGFLAYCTEDRSSETHDDLWAVINLARNNGYGYVLFDRDAPSLDPQITGLQIFDW